MTSTKSTVFNITYLIGFLGLKNVGKDTKIMIIGEAETSKSLKSVLQRSTVSHFQFLSGKHWNDVVVPVVFEISILKNAQGQSFMLSSGSAHLDQNMLPYPLQLV